MEQLPWKLIAYGLVAVGLLLFNYLSDRFFKWQKQQQEEQARRQPAPPRAPVPRQAPARTARPVPAPVSKTIPRVPVPAMPRPSPTPTPRPAARREPVMTPALQHLQAHAAATMAQRRPRTSVAALLGDRQSLRNTIIAMTVLGPCRAQQPYDEQP